MTQAEILAQFERMTPSQQQALIRKLQKKAQKSVRKASGKDNLPTKRELRTLRRENQLGEVHLLTEEEKQVLRSKLRQELREGAYAPLQETEQQRLLRLASIPPAEAMTGVIRWKGANLLTDEELKEDYVKHLIRKYS